ncbi:unnamed protein product [Ectocarpus sp. 8 AP-2014]
MTSRQRLRLRDVTTDTRTTSCSRDGPELKRDDNGQVAEVRLPSKLSSAMSFLAVIGSIFVGSAVGGTFSQYIGNRILIRDTWMDLSVQLFLGMASAFITTWRDPYTGPSVAKKRGRRGGGGGD